MYSRNDLTNKLTPIDAPLFKQLKQDWFEGHHQVTSKDKFIAMADEWFRSTKLNDIQGWGQFPCVDAILGCTHYIESFIIKHGWDGMQILPDEYGYYGMMGKFGNDIGNLEPGKPLIVSLPNWKYADIRPHWDQILKECEAKNIDIHIDFAWITNSRDIEFNLDHPNIKSFAMSLSKYSLQWNRVGLRWSRQRTLDSITMLNHYYGDVNIALFSCGVFMMENIPRDYAWETYREQYLQVCQQLDLIPSKFINAAFIPGSETPVGVANIITEIASGS